MSGNDERKYKLLSIWEQKDESVKEKIARSCRRNWDLSEYLVQKEK